jgi:hypothetical protein
MMVHRACPVSMNYHPLTMHYYYFFASKSRISVSKVSSFVTTGAASGVATSGFLSEFIAFTTIKIQKATIKNYITVLIKFP